MTSIREKLDSLTELNKLIEEKEKQERAPKRSMWDIFLGRNKVEKEYKLPGKVKRGIKRKIKKNYAIVIYIMTNGNIDIFMAPIIDDKVYIKQSGLYHIAMANYVLRYKNYPVLVIKQWALSPLNPESEIFNKDDELRKDVENKNLALPQKIIIDLVKKANEPPKKGLFGSMMWIWIVVIIIAVIFLFVKFILPKLQGG